MTNSGSWIVQRAAVTVAMAGCLVAVLIGTGLIGTSVDRSAGGALAAMAWGLGWIAVGRFTGDPGSVPTAVAAVAAALLALAAAGFARTRRRPGSGQGPANLAVL